MQPSNPQDSVSRARHYLWSRTQTNSRMALGQEYRASYSLRGPLNDSSAERYRRTRPRLVRDHTSSNRDLVAVLEAADLARTFERFLELPAELRNMVYGYAFNDFFAAFNIFHPARIPAVCQTSRAVRQEALYVLVRQEDGYTATLKRMGVVVPVTKEG
ncbi:hypothetical protein LTR17_011107 [Elasticomyces elasticus]|nr:hypothetical protein LTR17_011107 [Elasticomyces elasticus]